MNRASIFTILPLTSEYLSSKMQDDHCFSFNYNLIMMIRAHFFFIRAHACSYANLIHPS